MLINKNDYSFRIKLNRVPEHTINIDSSSYEIIIEGSNYKYTLESLKNNESLKNSTSWIFYSSGYTSKDEAKDNGEKFLKIIFLVLTKLKVGAEFGLLSYDSKFNSFGRLLFPDQRNPRYLDDFLGLTIYETEPKPEFKLTPVNTTVGTPLSKMNEAFNWAFSNFEKVSNKKRIAFELFLSSYFYKSITTRFIILIITIESLLEPRDRSGYTKDFLTETINQLKADSNIDSTERTTIINILNGIKKESIGKTGRDLASRELGEKKYSNLTAPQFFQKCYDLRGKIVHRGITDSDRKEVRDLIGHLENFVSDILCETN